MKMSRRSFLGGMLTLAAVAAAGPTLSLAGAPTIYGDGLHDDWAGLQAMFNGEPFRVSRDGGVFTATAGEIRGGHFLLSRTVVIRTPGFYACDAHITAMPGFTGPVLFKLEGGNFTLVRCTVSTAGMTKGALI